MTQSLNKKLLFSLLISVLAIYLFFPNKKPTLERDFSYSPTSIHSQKSLAEQSANPTRIQIKHKAEESNTKKPLASSSPPNKPFIEEEELDLASQSIGGLKGRFRDPRGNILVNPTIDLNVTITYEEDGRNMSSFLGQKRCYFPTDKEGVFLLPWEKALRLIHMKEYLQSEYLKKNNYRINLAFNHKSYCPVLRTLTPPFQEKQIHNLGEIEFSEGRLLSGIVYDARGNPLENAGIHVEDEIKEHDYTYSCKRQTDKNGKFSIGGLAGDQVKLTITPNNSLTRPHHFNVILDGLEKTFTLNEGLPITGIIKTEEGKPAHPLSVSIDIKSNSRNIEITTKTSHEGYFSFTGLPEGEHQLKFKSSSWLSEKYYYSDKEFDGPKFFAGTKDNVVFVKEKIPVYITALDEKTREPLEKFSITYFHRYFYGDDSEDFGITQIGASITPESRFIYLMPGDRHLKIIADGYQPSEVTFALPKERDKYSMQVNLKK